MEKQTVEQVAIIYATSQAQQGTILEITERVLLMEHAFKAGAEWQSTQPAGDGWVKEKPEWKEDCILLTASEYNDYTEYHAWEIRKLDAGEGAGSSYWAWCDLDGEEYGDINDLKAEWYKVIPTLSDQTKLPAPPKS